MAANIEFSCDRCRGELKVREYDHPQWGTSYAVEPCATCCSAAIDLRKVLKTGSFGPYLFETTVVQDANEQSVLPMNSAEHCSGSSPHLVAGSQLPPQE